MTGDVDFWMCVYEIQRRVLGEEDAREALKNNLWEAGYSETEIDIVMEAEI